MAGDELNAHLRPNLRRGATEVFLPAIEEEGAPKDEFLRAVKEAAKGQFEILGELGRRSGGEIAYLAKDLSQPRLVALRFQLRAGSVHDYVVDVVRELDGSIPARGAGCLRCTEPLRGWGRFCPKCGYDLSGLDVAALSSSKKSVKDLFKSLAGTGYGFLGEMPRGDGAGSVIFAQPRDEKSSSLRT